jgi:hypothetical protein
MFDLLMVVVIQLASIEKVATKYIPLDQPKGSWGWNRMSDYPQCSLLYCHLPTTIHEMEWTPYASHMWAAPESDKKIP